MTERLYYTEPARCGFGATIVAIERPDGRVLVRLDRSAFYPTSGGQPFDTGTLGGARVVDVFDGADGPGADLVHVVESEGRVEGLQVGQRVQGLIDWPRRFDHMQQHTGQHVLSAAFDRLSGAHTVSFHLGADAATIDLDREVTPAQIAAAESAANRIVWENRAVTIRFVSREEAAQLPLRKPPAKEGILRLIDVEGFDLSACGGTHVARTGAIGVIAIASWERFKGGQRIEFLSGGRALARFRSLRDTTAAAVRVLSVSASEVPESIERLQSGIKEQRRALAALQIELARYRAEELAASAEETPNVRLVARALDADASGLKALASAVTAHPRIAAVLVSTGMPALVVIARSPDLDVRSNDVLAALMATFGGRGGGKPDLAQGGGLSGTAEDILAAARRLLTSGKSGRA
jgi:alanyl-tRNA synthetase